MHCLNPSYDTLVILPPYNTVWAQVIKRGDPPQVLTTGLKVEYRIIDNTTSYGKREYGGFWDNAVQLFGSMFGFSSLNHDIGLTGNGLAGEMKVDGDHFVVTGIPVTPVNDNNTWSPFQVAEITVKDAQNSVLISTRATVPSSDEINCAKCHGDNPFDDILAKHDGANGTSLASSTPVLCASCHGSPALGTTGPGSSGKYLSQAIHGYHASRDATCYDCHPGQTTQCSRSVRHTANDGNCTTCHGDLANVAATIENGRVPWGNEPKCATCHTGVDGVETGNTLYRNAKGHGQLYCAVCHGSPHAMYPSSVASDNYQPLQYQKFASTVKTIGSCGACHGNSRGGDDLGEYSSVHGGDQPETANGCYICHTSVSTDTQNWPHSYQWKNSNN